MTSSDSRALSTDDGRSVDVRPFDAMTLADVCVDLILTGDMRPRFGQVEQLIDDISLQLGGSAAIFALQLARLGFPTAMLGWLRADVFGDFVRVEPEKTGFQYDLFFSRH